VQLPLTQENAGQSDRRFCVSSGQSLSGPGSISPPPLVDEPNFGVVSHPPDVVRGGFSLELERSASAELPRFFMSSARRFCIDLSVEPFSCFFRIDSPASSPKTNGARRVPIACNLAMARTLIQIVWYHTDHDQPEQ
jgi:hypothetical protein